MSSRARTEGRSGDGSSVNSKLGKLKITDKEKDINENDVFEDETKKGRTETKKSSAVKEEPKKASSSSMSIEKRMAERRQLKAADQKKKVQGRNAFKQQLDANAPKGEKPTKFMGQADSNISKLFNWAQRRTSVYPGVDVKDFTSSWADGMAFCALLHSLCPDDFPMDQMSEDDKEKNLNVAFKFATSQGVPELLDVGDMMRAKVPDSKSVITYVHCIYKTLVADKKQRTGSSIGSIGSDGSTSSAGTADED